MSIESDLAQIAIQESRLVFQKFDADTAWEIGLALKAAAGRRGLSAAFDIRVNGFQLFFYAMPGMTPDNIDWIRRKINVVQRFHRSSYRMGLELRQKGTSLTETVGVEARDFATHGGCFPIRLAGSTCIGTITVSGLPQRQDHELVVEVLANHLGLPLVELALPPEGG